MCYDKMIKYESKIRDLGDRNTDIEVNNCLEFKKILNSEGDFSKNELRKKIVHSLPFQAPP